MEIRLGEESISGQQTQEYRDFGHKREVNRKVLCLSNVTVKRCELSKLLAYLKRVTSRGMKENILSTLYGCDMKTEVCQKKVNC